MPQALLQSGIVQVWPPQVDPNFEATIYGSKRIVEETVRALFPEIPRDIPIVWHPKDETYITHAQAMDPAAANLGMAAAP
jgi:hypothetical protein